MSDDLIKQLRYWENEPCLPGPASACKAAADLIEQQAVRIAALEAQIATVEPAVDAQPVAIVTETHDSRGKPDLYTIMATSKLRIGDRLYASAQSEGLRKDAERYRWLKERYTGFDFDWMADDDGKNGKQVICFSMDDGMRIGRDIDAAIDVALSQHTGEKDD